jgi:hypothetical protein
VAIVVINNFSGEIILSVTQKLSISNVLIYEVFVALFATQLATSTSIGDFMLEGDALLVILVVNQSYFFFLLDILLPLF